MEKINEQTLHKGNLTTILMYVYKGVQGIRQCIPVELKERCRLSLLSNTVSRKYLAYRYRDFWMISAGDKTDDKGNSR